MVSSVAFVHHRLERRAVEMSFAQSFILFSVKNTWNIQVSIIQPRIILVSDGSPSARCLVTFMISLCWVVSSTEGGLNKHSRASGTAWVTLILLSPSSIPAMKISSMKLSATMLHGGKVTNSGSTDWKGTSLDLRLGLASRNSNFDCRVDVFHDGSRARSHARSVMLSLMRLNNGGAGLEPNGR